MSESLSHDTVLELLPWFVNGTLAGPEHELVARHVRECLPCHLELKEQRRLCELVQDQPTVHISAEQGFDELLGRLDGSKPKGSWPIPAARALARRPRLALAGLTLIAFLGVFSWMNHSGSLDPRVSDYMTLSDESRSKALLLDIVFSEQVTEAQMRALVRDLDAAIVGGPTDLGRYTVRLLSPQVTDAEFQAVMQQLNADRRVRFVGRTLIEEADSR